MAVDQAAISLALHEIAAHPAVRDMQPVLLEGDGAHVTFGLDLSFGARWVAEGQSPTGVLPVETVRFDFRGDFPLSAARPSLRPDFSRDHPHIQPGTGPEGRVVPCLVDGSIDEFVAAHGHYQLVDQFVIWLRKAAEARLIDEEQGWEPMRRDEVGELLICDQDVLRARVDLKGGFQFYRSHYVWRRPEAGDVGEYTGEVVEAAAANLLTLESPPDGDEREGVGVGVMLAVWAGRAAAGGPLISSTYLPEHVHDFAALRARAAELGMGEQLDAGLALLRRNGRHPDAAHTFPLPVVLLVRRPVHLIGSESNIELLPYLVPFAFGADLLSNPKVTPLGMREAIAPALLRRMSGTASSEPWHLLGCGSLGSKIALHRARAGDGPEACADRGYLFAHNAARHGLYPRQGIVQFGWAGHKVTELAASVKALGSPTTGVVGSHRKLVGEILRDKLPPANWLINTTASTIVREDLGGAGFAKLPRIVEACLFDKGRLGYFAAEGAGHNPNTAELIGELFEIARQDGDIGPRLFDAEGQVGTVSIGQGCSSVTMVMSDAEISAMAAPMSELAARLSSKVANGRIDLLLRDDLSIGRRTYDCEPWRRVDLEGLDGWSVSVSPRAYQQIADDVSKHRRTETGGVLVGWVSMIARRISVTSVLPAPKDSTRSAAEFVLGTAGLSEELVKLARQTSGALACVGTWHSHLGAATPSPRDRNSAAMVGMGEPRPMAFLIWGADGLRAISAAAQPAQVEPA